MSKPLRGLSLVWILGLALWVPSYGQELSYELTIKDHRFEPLELQVPAGKRFKLVVKNLDPAAEEFESSKVCFLTPDQLEHLPAKYFDLFITISSLQEMKIELVRLYISLIDRLTGGYCYVKQKS